MWDFAHGKYIWMWSDIHFSQPYKVAMPGVERERELECYRSLDKDCSHRQVSRPGQLNTEADPSTCAHPWDRDLERQDGNRRGCQRVLFKVSSLWRLLICWKRYKVNNIKFSRTLYLYFLSVQKSRLVYVEYRFINCPECSFKAVHTTIATLETKRRNERVLQETKQQQVLKKPKRIYLQGVVTLLRVHGGPFKHH